MSKLPWLQFFTGDWLKDPKLSMCQPATRGIWIDIISAAHELRSGTLTGTPDQLARICRCTVPDLCLALTDLTTTGTADIRERGGVFSVTCRRLAREEKERVTEREKKQRQRSKNTCPENVPEDNSYDKSLNINELQKYPPTCPPVVPEMSLLIYDSNNKDLINYEKETIREETQEVIGGCGGKEKPKKPPGAIDLLFKKFWEAYPRKENPQRAMECWEKLKPDEALVATMFSWIEKARESEQWRDKSKIPHPSTWLSEKRWLGDPPPMAINHQARAPAIQEAENAASKAEKEAEEAEARSFYAELLSYKQPEEWVQASNAIRGSVSAGCFETWFRPIMCLGIKNGELDIVVPTNIFGDCLRENYAQLLLKNTGACELKIQPYGTHSRGGAS